MRTLIVNPLLNDPLYSQKNPHQAFLLVFTIVAIMPILLGQQSPSSVMNANVNAVAELLWYVLLGLGSTLALVGEFWRGHTWTALSLEGAGLMLVGVGTAIYTTVLWADAGTDATYATAVTAAYAVSCLWRVGQVVRRLIWLRDFIREINEGVGHGSP